MKASTDTRLMRGMGLVPELVRIELETRVVSETGIKPIVGFEINSVVGFGMLTGSGSDRSSERLKDVSSSDNNSFWLAKTD
jgi:hypothetical protein